jgi:hypothetical protein
VYESHIAPPRLDPTREGTRETGGPARPNRGLRQQSASPASCVARLSEAPAETRTAQDSAAAEQKLCG